MTRFSVDSNVRVTKIEATALVSHAVVQVFAQMSVERKRLSNLGSSC